MNESSQPEAWLEAEDGQTLPLSSPYKIGRAPGSSLAIDDDDASRNHALFSRDPGDCRWWLSDLQSTNGTYVNGQRIVAALALEPGDRIRIGSFHWTFRLADDGEAVLSPSPSGRTTVAKAEMVDCWLLVADVIGSTSFVRERGETAYIAHLEAWCGQLESLIRDSGGFINERMGDGFLAVWDARRAAGLQVLAVMDAIVDGLDDAVLPHRGLLHYGPVMVGGGGRHSGLERLTGDAINLVFKAERGIGERGPGVFISEVTRRQLACGADRSEPIGQVSLPGFPEAVSFHRLLPRA